MENLNISETSCLLPHPAVCLSLSLVLSLKPLPVSHHRQLEKKEDKRVILSNKF